MLAEALLYARARLAGQHDHYGHLAEQVAIWARHRRQRQAWAEHLTRARALCLMAAEACTRRRTALVLGAGVLLDVPLERLSALFTRVVLADMAFLPGTMRLAKRLGNVELVTADLSGCLDTLPDAQALAARTPAPTPNLSLGLPGLDFVHSANLLSQLPLHAVAALHKQGLGPPACEDDIEAFAASLVAAHLSALHALPCPASLVADTCERTLADDETLHSEIDLLYGVPLPFQGKTWTWRLAPRGEISPSLHTQRLVLGAPNIRAASTPPTGGPHA
ncbi:hypothetical protein [Humidesulfovibrio sp.]